MPSPLTPSPETKTQDPYSQYFKKCTALFRARLQSANGSRVTEDCFRYDFYAALLQSGVKAHHCLLEYLHPHAQFKSREIDFVHTDDSGKLLGAFEMKYFKAIPSGNQDRTAYMAKLIIDLMKLHFLPLPEARKYMLLATDRVLVTYLNNESLGFHDMLQSDLNKEFPLSPSHKKGELAHFRKVIEKDISSVLNPFDVTMRVRRVFEENIGDRHAVIAFEVL
ncbi:hypothetical protein [Archangium sp.]|jgi:hypothetical protein|uniref:hypothetical protein n=1 Tax=Archangium sp. TaxID=1872627 RepID=UPI002ED962A5